MGKKTDLRADYGTVTVYPYDQLGYENHGWLKARHHFSFAGYHNPKRLEFCCLRVINDDIVEAGQGFATHPHKNMEIITYVRRGAITHKDSLGNSGRTGAGDVQVMSAGSGVMHSEFNLEDEEAQLYQIWIKPNQQGVTPRWETKSFPRTPVSQTLHVLVSGQKQHANTNALFIHQDAALYGGKLKAGTSLNQEILHQAYMLASQGQVMINGTTLNQGDGAEIVGTKTLSITATTDAEIIIIDVPK